MRTILSFALIFICLMVSAQSNTVKQEPSKAAYAERLKKGKPRATRVLKSGKNKRAKNDSSEPSEAAYAEKRKKGKPKAIKMQTTEQSSMKATNNCRTREQGTSGNKKTLPQSKTKEGNKQNKTPKAGTAQSTQNSQQNQESTNNSQKSSPQNRDSSGSLHSVAENPRAVNNSPSNTPAMQNNQTSNVNTQAQRRTPQKISEMSREEAAETAKNVREVKKKNKLQEKENSQNTPKKNIMGIVPFFYGNPEKQNDKGMPDIVGSYKRDDNKIDEALARKKAEADKKVTINGRSMSRKQWEDFFQNNSFSKPEIKEAQKEWLEIKHQVESIKAIQPLKTKQKQNESPDQYKDRLKTNEYKYRDQVRKLGNSKVNDYLDRLENMERKDGKVYQSAPGVNQTAEKSSTEGLNKLANKFKDCKEC